MILVKGVEDAGVTLLVGIPLNTLPKWSDRTRIYPVAMINLVILVTRVHLPIPLQFGWVST